MEKTTANNETSIDNTLNSLNENYSNKREMIDKERKIIREITGKKLQNSGEMLKENVRIQRILEGALKQIKFYGKDIHKRNYIYFLFLTVTIIAAVIAGWTLRGVYSNTIYFIPALILIFVLANCIAYFFTSHIMQRKAYKKYIESCKYNNINNEDMIKLVNVLLDNDFKLSIILPSAMFNYFTREYYKTDLDIYFKFLCKNNKQLWKKYKNRRLHFYRGIYSLNMDMLLAIEEIENNYFQSKFNVPVVDTLQECVDKFLRNN
jgi:hypothetical protein